MSQDKPAASEPSEIAGRYQVVQKLGAGAFGTVYKAKDRILGRMVAIKTIRLDGLAAAGASIEELVERFKREAQVSARLKHPNIVTIYDIGEAEGLSYLAMEFIDGVGLDRVISAAGRLPLERAAAIGAQIADALDYAHRNSVVHRDIKPANVMIEAGDRVKVTDFGIAKAIDSGEHLTVTGSLLGTPSYMSPEQARGGAIDGRSDLFAVGCILYEMLTGKKAFRGDSITALIFKIITEEPPPLRELEPSVPEPVAAIVARAISKAPETRYQTGRDLVNALLALTTPAAVPTVRQVETPTLKAPAPDAEATRVTKGPAVTPPTQVAARTAVNPPALRPAKPPAPQALPQAPRRSVLPLLVLVGVAGFALLLAAGAGTWWFFLRKPVPQPVASADTTAGPASGTEVAAASPSPAGTSEAATAASGGQATPSEASSSGVANPSFGQQPPPSPVVAPTQVAVARATPPPQATSEAHSDGGSAGYSFLDEEADQTVDGRQAGRSAAEAYGGSSRNGSSFGTNRQLRMRARSPLPRAPGERPALGTLRFLMNVEEAFNSRNGRYGTLAEISAGRARYLDVAFQPRSFQRRGYRFELAVEGESFTLTATPLAPGLRAFVGDDSGYIRVAGE